MQAELLNLLNAWMASPSWWAKLVVASPFILIAIGLVAALVRENE